eukprot:3061521-Pyramimonas_sp.AAC.1
MVMMMMMVMMVMVMMTVMVMMLLRLLMIVMTDEYQAPTNGHGSLVLATKLRLSAKLSWPTSRGIQ